MNVIKINPYEKSIKIVKLESLNNEKKFIEDLLSDAAEVEENLKIVAYPMSEKGPRIFYYLKQIGEDILKTYPFYGIGLAFGDINEKMLEKFKENIMWQ